MDGDGRVRGVCVCVARIGRVLHRGVSGACVPGPLLAASALAVGVSEGLGVGPHSPATCRGPVLGVGCS
jgi:hypothetical protein